MDNDSVGIVKNVVIICLLVVCFGLTLSSCDSAQRHIKYLENRIDKIENIISDESL